MLDTIHKKRDSIYNLVHQHKGSDVYVFGSCARKEETPDSDVDLIVTYTDSDSLSLMDIGGMVYDLSKIVKRPVDLIEDAYLMPFARQSADHDKIKIYERAN